MFLKYYKTIPCLAGDEQSVRNYVYALKTSFKKAIFFRTAPGTDDDVVMTTCIFGFYCHFSFLFLSVI